jgi:hypothetical protein
MFHNNILSVSSVTSKYLRKGFWIADIC